MAQTLEPRLYSNAPKDFNFLVLGYAYTQGALADNAALDLKDPQLQVNIGYLAYARAFDTLSKSSRIDVVVPTACINGYAQTSTKRVSRDVCGLGDTKVRYSINILGAPALSLKEFASYKQDTLIGISLQASLPTGQYDNTKLVNISTHRWAIKPGIGISQAINNFIIEASLDAEFYTQNSEFFGSNTRQQAPVYSAQTHLIYNISRGMWLGVDANYYVGGENTNNGVKAGDGFDNSRYGATFAFALNKKNSIKIYGNSGISTRTGTNFDMLAVAWQYRFAKEF